MVTRDSTEPERTADGRFIVVAGRRWRATDPAIPDALRQELVDELMHARRAVGAAMRTNDESAERRARDRVQMAKVALGERGEPWWEQPSAAGMRRRVGAGILALAAHRSPSGTTCPSDAARAVGGASWRSLMETARDAARDLAAAGSVEITQRGEVIDASRPWKGPIRIRWRDPASKDGQSPQ